MGRGKCRKIRNRKAKPMKPRNRKVLMSAASNANELGVPGIPGLIGNRPEPVVDMLGNKIKRDDPPVPDTEYEDDPPCVTSGKTDIVLVDTTIEQDPLEKAKGKRTVNVIRDHTLEFPDLYQKIYVSGDPDVRDDESRFALIFARSSCSRAASPAEADLVIFAGGSDVDPALYGESRHESVCYDSRRDKADIELYHFCQQNGIPMVGVCRGAQFLHVMNGGKLYQDVDGHNGDHTILDIDTNILIDKVSSVHHQMVRSNLAGGMQIIATAKKATKKWKNASTFDMADESRDIEAFFYRDTCCLGFQGHPEYHGYNYYAKWCLEKICEYIVSNPDLVWIGKSPSSKALRMKPELRKAASIIGVTPSKMEIN